MTLMQVDKDLLQDQADILFILADNVFADTDHIRGLLRGGGNLLVAIWEVLDVGSDALVKHEWADDHEANYGGALEELKIINELSKGDK